MKFLKYIKTAQMSAQSLTNGGIVYLLPGYLLKIVYLIPLLSLWRSLMKNGVNTGMSLPQMLAYTYLGAILSDILVVHTKASGWLYEGLFISLFQRPLNVLLHLVSQTIGEWLPQVLFLIFPMAIAAPLFGVSLRIYSLWFFLSLILCISLGFAIDLLFVCLTIRLQNANWLVYVIRNAIVALLSGSVIPFSVFPDNIGRIFQCLPLGSLAGAPLSIYTGLAEPFTLVTTQIIWNVMLWPAAIALFERTRERMVSYGG